MATLPISGHTHDHAGIDIPQALWNLRVPLFITHKNQPDSPFITSVPRFSYLAQLLPRLYSYFNVPCSSFHHEEVQLRNLTVGLLVDLYQPQLPWKLEVGDGVEWDIGDTFLNGVKEVRAAPPPLPGLGHGFRTIGKLRAMQNWAVERLSSVGDGDTEQGANQGAWLEIIKQADFIRNGNAKQIMSLSKDHTTELWNAVQDSELVLCEQTEDPWLSSLSVSTISHLPLAMPVPHLPRSDVHMAEIATNCRNIPLPTPAVFQTNLA